MMPVRYIAMSAIAFALLVILVLHAPILPAENGLWPADAGDEYHYECNESQNEALDRIWGENITLGEYYEITCPEMLSGMPEDLKERLYSTRVVWPAEPDGTGKIGISTSWMVDNTTTQGNR
jgi:hypothetical protein